MKEIYCIFNLIPYEGEYILGAYTTKKSLKLALENIYQQNREKDYGLQVIVKKVPVNDIESFHDRWDFKEVEI